MSSLPNQTVSESVVGDTTPVQPVPQAARRVHLFFLDHLRATLTIQVVLHHLAVIYGAAAVFYYVEPPGPTDQLAQVALTVFVLINQAYFMGFFFLISGYFTPGSFDHKGAGTFYKDRLLRLGIPLLIYMFVLSPVAVLVPALTLGLYQMPASSSPFPWQQLLSLFGVGPLWFAEMLLIFCFGYIIWRRMVRARVQPAGRVYNPPSYPALGLFILMLALVSYVMRIIVPLGVAVPILGFPSLAYLPQYLSFFILGMIAFRRNWFQTIPASVGKTGFVVALVATVVLAAPALSGGAAFPGYGSWQSAVYGPVG